MTSLLLGLRLAVTPAARLRTVLLVLAAMAGTTILLVTVAAGRQQLVTAPAYQQEMPRVVLAIVAAIALPCAVLVATVARLSASLRDRRLANLRLIGLSANQTRLVGTGEAGGAALVGALLGWAGFWLLRPLLVGHAPVGRAWGDLFVPTLADQALVAVGIPVVAVVASVLPARSSVADALAVTRRADRTPPSWWRLAPLVTGMVLCLAVVVWTRNAADGEISDPQATLLFAGIGLLALGLVLVLPVLVRMLTRAASGRPLGPATRIAVRRLEAQPAGVARIIAALLIGLFLATGARFVLVAFESTNEYQQAERNHTVQQRVEVVTTEQQAGTVTAGLARADGVDDVVDLPILHNNRLGMEALVATCDQLAAVAPGISGCRDGRPMRLHDYPGPHETGTIAWESGDQTARSVATTPADLPATRSEQGFDALSPIYADVIIPPEMVAPLPPDAWHSVLVVGPPGPDLASRLADLGYGPSYYGTEEYDFVASMRAVIWTVAGVVLAVGLLALTVAAIDRAAQRRKEVVALQLVGVGRGVLRRAQALETAVPVTIGAVLAVGLGALAGATYLSLDDTTVIPWAQTLVLAAVAVVGGVGVAAVTMVAAAPRLRPDEIRAE